MSRHIRTTHTENKDEGETYSLDKRKNKNQKILRGSCVVSSRCPEASHRYLGIEIIPRRCTKTRISTHKNTRRDTPTAILVKVTGWSWARGHMSKQAPVWSWPQSAKLLNKLLARACQKAKRTKQQFKVLQCERDKGAPTTGNMRIRHTH